MVKQFFGRRSNVTVKLNQWTSPPTRTCRIAAPPFEVQGHHVLFFVAALMGTAQLAGLLPDP